LEEKYSLLTKAYQVPQKNQTKREKVFEDFASLISSQPWPTLLGLFITVGILASGIRNIHFDTSTEGFLKEDNTRLRSYKESRDTFGASEFIILIIEGHDIFQRPFLNTLQKLHHELKEKVPYLEDVESLLTARHTYGQGDALIVEDLFQTFPESQQELARLRKITMNNPFYRDLLVSADGKITTLVVKPTVYDAPPPPNSPEGADAPNKSDAIDFEDFEVETDNSENSDYSDYSDNSDATEDTQQTRNYLGPSKVAEIIQSIRSIAAKYSRHDFKITISGSPIITHDLQNAMRSEMQTFIRFTIALIAVFLGLMFRRISGVILPLLVVVFSLISTVGLMGWFHQPLQLPTVILPSFLLVVAVGDAVHFLAYFYRFYEQSKDKEAAIRGAMGHCGLPMLLTALTTAAGLLSFAGSDLKPLSNLGLFSASGVMLAFCYTITLLPAALRLIPLKLKDTQKNAPMKQDRRGKLLEAFANVSIAHSKVVIVTAGVILASSVYFASHLKFSHDPLEWLPKSMESYGATKLIDQKMGGTIGVDIIIDSGHENGLHNPKLLSTLANLMDTLGEYRDGVVAVGKVTGLTDLLRETHRALNGGDDEFYKIPDTPEAIAQELSLFENSGSDDLSQVVDRSFRKTKVRVIMPWFDALKYAPFIKTVTHTFREGLKGQAEVIVTGLIPIMGETLDGVIRTTAESYAIVLCVISVLMILLLRDVRLGFMSMFPNLLPILFMMAVMQLMAFPLDMFTMLIASIAIGIVVDDTVHFMYHYQHSYKETRNSTTAIQNTLQGAGRAMLVTSLVLAGGFGVFCLSDMSNVQNFGFLTAGTIALALLADFLLAPALMNLIHGSKSKSHLPTPSA